MRIPLWLRRFVGPPPATRARTPAERRALASGRAVIVLTALLTDVWIYWVMRDQTWARHGALLTFFVANMSLLGIDLALVLLVERRVAWLPGRYISAFLEVTTALIWVQLTGSVSSYFIVVGVLLPGIYRIIYGHSVAVFTLILVCVLHAAMVIVEEVGLLPVGSLFLEGVGPVYGSSFYREVALVSCLWTYLVMFGCVNYFANVLMAKDMALEVARDDLARALEGAEFGRLSGHVIADRYELREILGRGGMGEVYKGRRVADQLEVAVKIMYDHLGSSHEMRARFEREARVASRLPARFVAPVLEVGHTADGHQFIVMEYLRGEDLGAMLRVRKQLLGPEVVKLTRRIAEILDAAHAAGIVHRDLKPQNVFLVPPDDVRLLDFGISKLHDAAATQGLTATQAVLGTPGYMAPEQAMGDLDRIGPAADLFSLGVIIYRALTGRDAFQSRTPAAAIYEVIQTHPAPPTSIRPDLHLHVDDMLTIALAKDPKDRPLSAAAMVEALEAALAGELPVETQIRAVALRAQRPGWEATLTSVGTP